MIPLEYLLIPGTLAGLAWAYFFEPNAFTIRTFNAFMEKPVKRKYRILHLTDIHFAGKRPALSRFFDRLGRDLYDFVFLTGDIFDSVSGVPQAVEDLKKLKSRFGVYAVWGNHDYYDYSLMDVLNMTAGRYPSKKNPIEELEKAVAEAGVRLLKNETVEIKSGEETFLIHGLDDPTTAHSDIPKIIQNAHPRKINILLSHSIDVFQELPQEQMSLAFSGHSHGGQICLPGLGPIVTHTKYGRNYASGLKRLKGATIAVSQGLGTSRFFPLRFLCRPEAIVLELKP